MKLRINGRDHDIASDPSTPLLWVLRDELAMTGTKFGCGIAACGACTVLIDGEATRTCVLPVSAVGQRVVTTIEGLSAKRAHPLQKAWIEHQVPQCGYCQSGMIMAAAGLLARTPEPTDADLANGLTNLCRCGTYGAIRAAIKSAAAEMRGAPASAKGAA